MFQTTTTTTTKKKKMKMKKNLKTSSSPHGCCVSSFASSKHSFFASRKVGCSLRFSIFRVTQLPRVRIGRKKRSFVFIYLLSLLESQRSRRREKKQNDGTPTSQSRASLSFSLFFSRKGAQKVLLLLRVLSGEIFLILSVFSLKSSSSLVIFGVF